MKRFIRFVVAYAAGYRAHYRRLGELPMNYVAACEQQAKEKERLARRRVA